jgi:catechol 2,3-dioxygenase-like lactoylglutathione lyase family enzyme
MRIHVFRRTALALVLAGLTAPLVAQDMPQRPAIEGIAHVAFSAHDLDKSRQFYSGFLGLDEVSPWKNADGTTAFTFFKINDHQFVELTPEHQPGTDRFGDVSFETNDVEAMRHYLAAKGLKVPDASTKGRIGNLAFKTTDPAGHSIEFVQYLPDGQTAQNFGKHLGEHRVSLHMTHAGLIVTDLEPEYRFFTDVLGFKETWRGSSDGKVLSWINLKSPDSNDYVELMLYKVAPPPDQRGSAHHICLVVPSVDTTVAALQHSSYLPQYGRVIEQHLGKNRKRQANLFDPDGTRVEIMEPVTIDGLPTPPSTAPPPQ